MKFLAHPLCLSILFASVVLPPLDLRSAPTIETFARLGGTPDGFHAESAPVQGPDGNFYGTTEAGGPANCGTIYQLTAGGTLTTLYTFQDNGDGSNPAAGLILGPDGNFYGTTPRVTSSLYGGNSPRVATGHGQGTVFRVTPTGVLTTIHGFSALDGNSENADGADPEAALLLGADGNFYGTTATGGANGGGTVFKMTPAGALTPLYNFPAQATGNFYGPLTALAQGIDGNFYGAAQGGGSGYGVIYGITPAGAVTLLHTFANGTDGGYPSALVRGTDGNFYGLTANTGGSNDGTAFRITSAGALTTLHGFDGDDGNISGSAHVAPTPLILGADGNFYGTAADGASFLNPGLVFELTPAGTVVVLYSFPSIQSPADYFDVTYPNGAYPAGIVQGKGGNFYGVTTAGGSSTASTGGASGGGTIFRLTPMGALTTEYKFINDGGSQGQGALLQTADGSFYGTTATGGTANSGAIFKVTPTGVVSTIHNFDSSAYQPDPSTGLVQGNNGILYGTTELGGAAGTIYSVTADGAFTILQNFDPGGLSPAGGIINADGMLLYGVSSQMLYAFTLATGVQAVYHTFGTAAYAPDGTGPAGIPVAVVNGTVLYGVTVSGGRYQQGTVYAYDIATGGYTQVYAFMGVDDGAQPLAPLILAKDGYLYGETSIRALGTDDPGNGTIFRIGLDGVLTTLHTFAEDGSEGSGGRDALLQASDGNFYGETGSTIFSMTPDGIFTTLGNVSGSNGPLIQAADGNLYGVTESGGTDDGGVIFRVLISPVVTLSVAVPEVVVNSGQVGEFLLTLDHPSTSDIQVAYTIKGSALPGVDYVTLKGTAKVAAGKTAKMIKITPVGDLGGASKKAVTLVLAPGDGYTVGTTDKVKVRILPAGTAAP